MFPCSNTLHCNVWRLTIWTFPPFYNYLVLAVFLLVTQVSQLPICSNCLGRTTCTAWVVFMYSFLLSYWTRTSLSVHFVLWFWLTKCCFESFRSKFDTWSVCFEDAKSSFLHLCLWSIFEIISNLNSSLFWVLINMFLNTSKIISKKYKDLFINILKNQTLLV